MSASQKRIPTRDEAARPSVLIVDDRASNLLALEAVLDPLGLDIVRAGSGEEALKHVLRQDFALILLDVQMPGMDGFETASALKAHPRTAEIPIIFITAISREAAHVFEGYAHGAVDYILKPFDPSILRAKASVFVELHTKTQTIKRQAALLHQREMEALERRQEQRYQFLTEAMPIVMWGARPDGDVYYVNRSWSEYSGLSAEQTGGLTSPAVVHHDDLASLRASWADAVSTRRGFETQCRLRGAGGAYRWHLVRTVADRSPAGVLEGWIVTATDIDDQKKLQEENERLLEAERVARRTAEAANRMKDDFLANVSHELRTPLNAILGWTRMLHSGMLDASRVSRALETIERSAQLQADMIEDLLDTTRIISGKLRLQMASVKLDAVVRAAVDTLRPVADSKGVELELLPGSDAEDIAGDPARLQQIVWNLVANAVKFTPKGGRVDVRITRQNASVEVAVTDSGVGISPDFLPYVFDRFRQQDNSTTRTHQGLGLGLAIARHLVDLHGGTIRADSAGLGKGSTFTVTLPTGSVTAAEGRTAWFNDDGLEGRDGQASLRRLDGLTVLFVDDQPEARELFTELFGQCGARVLAAGSVSEALLELEKSRPHILVSDIGLPQSDGFDLIRAVRAHPTASKLPAIAVSGYAHGDDRKRALAAGFQMYLSKPVDPAELVRLVASLADARQLPAENGAGGAVVASRARDRARS